MKVKVQFTLEQPTKAYSGSGYIYLLFLYTRPYMGVGGKRHAPAALSPRKALVSIAQEAGWAPGLVWTAAENLAPIMARSLDRPAHSQSLYRWRYLSPQNSTKVINIIIKVYTGLHTMILARHILAIQTEDTKLCKQSTLHMMSNDDTHLTHSSK